MNVQLRLAVPVQPAGAVTNGLETTVLPVTAEPPFDAGAVHETVARPLLPVAVTPVGAPGTVAGVTALETVLADPEPAALEAVTENVYAVPLVRPVNVQVRLAVFVQPAGAVTAGLETTV